MPLSVIPSQLFTESQSKEGLFFYPRKSRLIFFKELNFLKASLKLCIPISVISGQLSNNEKLKNPHFHYNRNLRSRVFKEIRGFKD